VHRRIIARDALAEFDIGPALVRRCREVRGDISTQPVKSLREELRPIVGMALLLLTAACALLLLIWLLVATQ
jgi:hypothetical protein